MIKFYRINSGRYYYMIRPVRTNKLWYDFKKPIHAKQLNGVYEKS